RPYLAYGAYRADVMLRETVVVGLAGAAGLGSQLLESLSSFAWDQLAALLLVYAALTLVGEDISDRLRRRWLGARRIWILADDRGGGFGLSVAVNGLAFSGVAFFRLEPITAAACLRLRRKRNHHHD
ncbi:MAG: hypothetical protein RLZZ537_688, partial [Pseudomonadota bacterium]